MKSLFASLFLAAALAASGAQAQTPSTSKAMTRSSSMKAGSTAMATVSLVDINTASKQQLGELKGIGPARADAIIKGRPYKGKDDLVQKKILSKRVYNGIQDKIVARQK